MTEDKNDLDSKKYHLLSSISLFEGIIIGIYGNWLISTIMLISFTSTAVWLQILLVCISILSLIALLWIGVVGGKLETRPEVIFLAIGHYIPLGIALIIEKRDLSDIFQLLLGGVLFAIIYYTEYVRARKITFHIRKIN